MTESNDELGRSLSESGVQIETLKLQLGNEGSALTAIGNELHNLKSNMDLNENKKFIF